MHKTASYHFLRILAVIYLVSVKRLLPPTAHAQEVKTDTQGRTIHVPNSQYHIS